MMISRDVRGESGGAVYRVKTLAKYLSKEGLEVFIVDSERNHYVKVVRGRFIIKRLPRSIVITLLSYVPNLINRLLTFLLRFPKEESGRISNVFNISLFLNLLRVALRERPCIIQVEEYFSLVPLAFIAKKIIGAKLLILDEHNVETHRLLRDPDCGRFFTRLVNILEHMACTLSDCVFVVSELDAQRLKMLVRYRGRVEIVPNFVDIETIKEQLKGRDKIFERLAKMFKPLLIFHGDFRYFPNREALHMLTTKIMPEVIKRHPKAMLIVAGAGLPKITRPNIMFMGYVENIYKLASVADIAVVPLLRGGGTRIKILEYMACKVPVVSTAVGMEGLCFENHKDIIIADIDSFADNIDLLVKNPNFRNLLVSNAVKKIEEYYCAEKVVKSLIQLYLKLLRHGD
ncbi:MAG: glycosyltransferase family 4 protein [Thermofilaceae archaeon]